MPFWSLFVAIAIGFGLGVAILWFSEPLLGRRETPKLDPDAAERIPASSTGLDAEEQQSVAVFTAAKESVVNVDTVVRVRRFDTRVTEQQTGTGSGFVWDDDRRIVTNFHVVREAAANRGSVGLRVVLGDKSAWGAEIVGVAPDYDLAVLQVDANAPKEKLKKIKVGTSADLQVGQKAFAIGNPFGLSMTMTKGIVSALDRQIESLTDRPITGAIQTDAPINPGNSGGPLLDKDGRLIGVNSSIATPSGGNVGIGFAIPVDTVNTVVTELIQRGRVLQPDLGLTLVDQRRLRRAGFAKGVMIQRIEPGGPAAQAGLRGLVVNQQTGEGTPGDLIVAVDGKPVNSPPEFAQAVAQHKIGDKVKLTIERGEQRMEVEVTTRGV
jgi:S1-C subfamily serine protease